MATKITVPELGESVLEASVGHWLKKEGDRVNAGEVVVELETDKVDLEVGAEQSGVLARIERREGEEVRIGDVLGVIEQAPAGAGSEAESREPGKRTAPVVSLPRGDFGLRTAESGARASGPGAQFQTPVLEPPATPSARRFAREHDVDLAQVSSGEASGRVTKQDVERRLVAPGPPPSREVSTAPPLKRTEAVPSGARGIRQEERVRMSRRRLTIARRLVEAQRTAAMLTTFNEVDMTAVMELRKRHKESFQRKYGVSLGIVSFFVKASIGALRAFPHLNAEIQGEEMILKHYYDIGVAVGASEGLVVPVLRDADRMSFAEIEIAIKDYVRKAEEGTLSLEDLRGGTFTISNGGVYGSLLSTPILNPPQVGILGLHKIAERPASMSGQMISRSMMYIALSYDHRIVDGSEAVQFLVRVKELVEDPASLLFEG